MFTSSTLFALGAGYLLGSIPFGLVLTRLAGKGDIRAIGSGNIGATNVLRSGAKGLAALTLLLDAAKGAAAVMLARQCWPGTEIAAAGAALIGHCFPLWLKFRGGKGVATLLGILIPLHPVAALIYALVWIGLLAAVRISSAAGIAAAASAPLVVAIGGPAGLLVPVAAFAALVMARHRANLARLLAGTEPRVGDKGERNAGGRSAE